MPAGLRGALDLRGEVTVSGSFGLSLTVNVSSRMPHWGAHLSGVAGAAGTWNVAFWSSLNWVCVHESWVRFAAGWTRPMP